MSSIHDFVTFHMTPRNRILFFSLLSGILFVVIFSLIGYHPIPSSYYLNRDDGIITLSHARNFVEYGTISINPSGELVEGFSAPVQFWLFAGLYKLTHISYDWYNQIQTYLSTFFIGMIFVLLFEEVGWEAVGLSMLAAFMLARDPSFIIWHGSGMENALTHSLFLLSFYLMVRTFRTW